MRFRFRSGEGEILTEVFVSGNRKRVEVKNYAQWPLDNAFGLKPVDEITWDDVYSFLKRRTFPENRVNLSDILKDMGLKKYDPVRMCMIGEGRIASDDNYIEFF